MTRDEARNKTVDILLDEKNPNNTFYMESFEQYNYGNRELTPISPLYMPNANESHNIVITEYAYRDLMKIKQITNQTNQEVPYFLIGEEKPNGTIWFDAVLSTFKPSDRLSASFTNETLSALEAFLNVSQEEELQNGNKQIICHGHSHGVSPVSDNFSFGDLISYVEMKEIHPLIKNKKVETMAMMMPPSGDF